MSKYFPHHTPGLLQFLFPQFTWKKHNSSNEIYITFDDGPVPEATPLVLQYLKEYNARATFFCVGENVRRYPEIFHRVISEGHSVGNHTFHHMNGWKTSSKEFLDDVEKCQRVIAPHYSWEGKPLMRPPYGRLKRNQWKKLRNHYQIIMWDVLSGDFSSAIDASTCLDKSIRYAKSGSIVLFHDSVKTIDKIKKVLPAFLMHFNQLGFTFQSL